MACRFTTMMTANAACNTNTHTHSHKLPLSSEDWLGHLSQPDRDFHPDGVRLDFFPLRNPHWCALYFTLKRIKSPIWRTHFQCVRHPRCLWSWPWKNLAPTTPKKLHRCPAELGAAAPGRLLPPLHSLHFWCQEGWLESTAKSVMIEHTVCWRLVS